MKMDAKRQDCEPVNPLFTSKSEQTLCETQSAGFAVQRPPDCETNSVSLISGQVRSSSRRRHTPRAPIYCAKSECYLVPLGRSGLFAQISPESVAVVSGYPWH